MQWVQSQAQALNVVSQHGITELGDALNKSPSSFILVFVFFFGCDKYAHTPQINRQLYLGSTRADGGAPVPPLILLRRRLETYSASLGQEAGAKLLLAPRPKTGSPQVSVTD